MTSEHETFAPKFDERGYAWDIFRYWTSSEDVARFEASYVGRYADRDAFGQELLHQLGVDTPLQRLPEWFRAYVRFDGVAVVDDFERAGHFYVYDAPHGEGTFVFDVWNDRPAAANTG